MLNSLFMLIIGLIFLAYMGYLAWDSYKDFHKNEPK